MKTGKERNLKIIIEYDGTNFHGWQRQEGKHSISDSTFETTKNDSRCSKECQSPKTRQSLECKHSISDSTFETTKNDSRCSKEGQKLKTNRGLVGGETIQQKLEEAFEKILQEKITVNGSGRTDAGVHAAGHVANFKTKGLISNWNLMLAVNSQLPREIRVIQIDDVDIDFHARFSAVSKLYQYKIYNAPVYSPLICRFAYYYSKPLVVAYMKEAAKILVGKHDFFSLASFSKLKESTIRTINTLTVERDKINERIITISIEGDGFLYNMVRTIAGTLLEIGMGQKEPSSCKKILATHDRELAGANLPALGLTLIKVNY